MGANAFQPRAIRGGYNPRYYNRGGEINYNGWTTTFLGRQQINYNMNYNQNNGFQKNSLPPRV